MNAQAPDLYLDRPQGRNLNYPPNYLLNRKTVNLADTFWYNNPSETIISGVVIDVASLLDWEEKSEKHPLSINEIDWTKRNIEMLFFEYCFRNKFNIDKIKAEAEIFFREYWGDCYYDSNPIEELEIVRLIKNAKKIEYKFKVVDDDTYEN